MATEREPAKVRRIKLDPAEERRTRIALGTLRYLMTTRMTDDMEAVEAIQQREAVERLGRALG